MVWLRLSCWAEGAWHVELAPCDALCWRLNKANLTGHAGEQVSVFLSQVGQVRGPHRCRGSPVTQ